MRWSSARIVSFAMSCHLPCSRALLAASRFLSLTISYYSKRETHMHSLLKQLRQYIFVEVTQFLFK